MRRRDFLRITGAVAAFGPRFVPLEPPNAATILYDDQSTVLDRILADPKNSKDVLWVRQTDLPRINGFELKPQGACRADLCIPVTKDMIRGEYFNLSGFARKVGQAIVADSDARVWSFGEIPAVQSGFLTSRIAPNFAVPDRKGRLVHLSDFRGKKVLVITWASW